jgi:aldehyde dehydrogenase (NAD+)
MAIAQAESILAELGIQDKNPCWVTGSESGHAATGEYKVIRSAVDGRTLGSVQMAGLNEYNHVMAKAEEAFAYWQMIPAPRRGEIVRQIGDELRKYKDQLGRLVTLEMGKIYQEGLGEVQEMIDI